MIPAGSGKVFFVGAGPGDPELLTLKASFLLQSADLVLHDDLVSREIIALVGPQALVMSVGKRCGAKRITQAQINGHMIEAARRGMKVVRLKSGDPLIFGRLGEELDALREASVDYEVIPGISAGFAAAAALGVSLTDRRTSSRVLIVSGHRSRDGIDAAEPEWANLSLEDTTVIVYMPGRELGCWRGKLLEAGLPGSTPCIIVSKATTPEHREHRTSLLELNKIAPMESPSILMIGRSLAQASAPLETDLASCAGY